MDYTTATYRLWLTASITSFRVWPLDDNSMPPLPEVISDEFIISLADVERKLSRINIHKSPGSGGLSNLLLCNFSSNLATAVCAIYNASVSKGFILWRWKEANVVPVPKLQPPKAVEADLHPFSLTAPLAKVLESFVRSWVPEWVGNSLDDRQYGALRQHFTTHTLVDMLHHCHTTIDKGLSVCTVFVHFSKAYFSAAASLMHTPYLAK